jgi:hypothetical protein
MTNPKNRGFNHRKQEFIGQKSKVGTTSLTADVLEVDPLLTPLAGECLHGGLVLNHKRGLISAGDHARQVSAVPFEDPCHSRQDGSHHDLQAVTKGCFPEPVRHRPNYKSMPNWRPQKVCAILRHQIEAPFQLAASGLPLGFQRPGCPGNAFLELIRSFGGKGRRGFTDPPHRRRRPRQCDRRFALRLKGIQHQ